MKASRHVCAYCGMAGADEEDHVIARQFFPAPKDLKPGAPAAAVERFRGALPKVWCCGSCNRKKQKVEDGPAVFLQFGDEGAASIAVAHGRVARTLRKNTRLLRSLQRGLQDVWLRRPSGILVPRLAIELKARELQDLRRWFRLVTRGLYCHETKVVLPPRHEVYLVKPADWLQFVFLRDMILQHDNHQSRSVAGGEFKYTYVVNQSDQVSMWLFAFKSVDVAAVTVGPDCTKDDAAAAFARRDLMSTLGHIRWS